MVEKKNEKSNIKKKTEIQSEILSRGEEKTNNILKMLLSKSIENIKKGK